MINVLWLPGRRGGSARMRSWKQSKCCHDTDTRAARAHLSQPSSKLSQLFINMKLCLSQVEQCDFLLRHTVAVWSPLPGPPISPLTRIVRESISLLIVGRALICPNPETICNTEGLGWIINCVWRSQRNKKNKKWSSGKIFLYGGTVKSSYVYWRLEWIIIMWEKYVEENVRCRAAAVMASWCSCSESENSKFCMLWKVVAAADTSQSSCVDVMFNLKVKRASVTECRMCHTRKVEREVKCSFNVFVAWTSDLLLPEKENCTWTHFTWGQDDYWYLITQLFCHI